MPRMIVMLRLMTLTACSDSPQLGLGFGVGPGGVTVSPNVSGNVGGVNVGVSGQAVDL